MTTQAAPRSPSAEPLSGIAVSVAFWLALLSAVGVFAGVSLSPKLAVYLALEDQHRSQQQELMKLEHQHAELERVIAALKDDPQFAAELTRLEFDAVRPGEEILSVDSSLTFNPNAVARGSLPSAVTRSPWRPWVAILAYNQRLRTVLFVTAAGLVLFAFGWLQDNSSAERPA